MDLDDVKADTSGFEDRRGQQSTGGGLRGLPIGRGGKAGIGGVVLTLLIVVAANVFGGGGGGGTGGFDPSTVLDQLGGGGASSGSAPAAPASAKDAQVRFVGQVRTLLNNYWSSSLADSGKRFAKPSFVVFDSPTPTGCGVGEPEAGPFYCPADQKVYLDFAFYDRLQKQLGFGGDFAEAYVIAHEYGHHIQYLLGINAQVQAESRGASKADANALSVQLELRADCFAGSWAHSAYGEGRVQPGDIDEALRAAAAVGDDAIQQKTQGRVDRESFTHGSSADRQTWFRTGFDSGDPSRCDTFV
jgi:predicted metalloprotease